VAGESLLLRQKKQAGTYGYLLFCLLWLEKNTPPNKGRRTMPIKLQKLFMN